MWSNGEQILMRHVLGGRVVYAVPSTVAGAQDDRIAIWIAGGTPIVYPNGVNDGRLMPLERWEIVRRPWFGTGSLDVAPYGRAYMIKHFWHEGGSFRGWYVNLQAPLRRALLGFDSTDHQLDLWIEPDGAVTWKDEDHLEQAVELGLFTAEAAAAVRTEAERVLDEWPFPTGWEDWRPDPAWPVPELPDGWETI
jgi:hypothetical protein